MSKLDWTPAVQIMIKLEELGLVFDREVVNDLINDILEKELKKQQEKK